VTDGLTQKEQEHFAKRLVPLAELLQERAIRTRKRQERERR